MLSNSGNYAKILLYAETKLLKFYNYEQFSFSLPKNIQKLPYFMHVRENDMCCAKFIFYICFCCTNRIKMLTIFYAPIAINCFYAISIFNSYKQPTVHNIYLIPA